MGANKVIKSWRRPFRERGQLASRTKLGMLEKHKDYVLRARDYHSKQKRLQAMREKARFRNPDEFYFKMINTKTKDGVHVSERTEAFPADTIKMLKSQDANYVQLKAGQEKKKIEKLRASLHMIEDEGVNNDNADQLEDEDGEGEEEKEIENKTKSKHVVFVDSAEDVEAFDTAKHFDTLPELVNRKFNRPRIETLEKAPLILNQANLKKVAKERQASYAELSQRLKRANKLDTVAQELQVQRQLMGKGRRRKIGKDSRNLPVYKWAAERKK